LIILESYWGILSRVPQFDASISRSSEDFRSTVTDVKSSDTVNRVDDFFVGFDPVEDFILFQIMNSEFAGEVSDGKMLAAE